MAPLHQWPAADRRAIVGVLTDIDDTLTTHGAATSDALAALAALRAASLPTLAVTGRPVGWSEPFARQWPLDAIVAENGAVALVPDRAGGVRKLYAQPAAVRAVNLERMQQAACRILREVPGAKLSRDSPGRETDIAFDHSEFTQLPGEAIDHVRRLMQDAGMNATVSSIHINGWYGEHHKLSGARWIVRELLGRELDAEREHWVFVGDSTNDERMFRHFPHSVGVANIRRFEAALTHRPRYITVGERGSGFAEVARALLAARADA